MAAPSPTRILRLIFCSRPQSDSSAMIVNHCCIMITLASLTSAIVGLYLLPGSPLLPSARSGVLVSFPHVWRFLLSWVTPPCLFVVINCIILTLTLTSGSFKGPSSAGSELYAILAKKMEAVPRDINYSPPPKVCKRRPAPMVPAEAIACKELEKEEAVVVQDKRTENDDCDDNDGDDARAMAASDPAQRSCHSQPASPSGQKQAAKCVRRAKSIDSSSMSPNRKHAIRHGSTSSYLASASYTSSASSSPSSSAATSDTFSIPSSPSSPSSPCSPNYGYSARTQFDPSHADELSDDDLRKRIEAFISKMNAQIRREAATSSMEY